MSKNINDNPPIDYKISLANQFVVLILPESFGGGNRPWFGRIIGGQCVNSYCLDTMGVEHMSPMHGYAGRFFQKHFNSRCE